MRKMTRVSPDRVKDQTPEPQLETRQPIPATPQIGGRHSLSGIPFFPSGQSGAQADGGSTSVSPEIEGVTPTVQLSANKTGMPDALKSSVEGLSGIALNDVRVHYNSPQPGRMRALAYTEGSEIHLGPGQEKHMAHEAWHVVQQKQGRVTPTLQAKGWAINCDSGLENEADIMGRQAMQRVASRLPSDALVHQSANHLGHEARAIEYTATNQPVRQFLCCGGSDGPRPSEVVKQSKSGKVEVPTLDEAINQKGVTSHPSVIADQLTDASEEFRSLRGRADEEVKTTYGRSEGVTYNERPKKNAGTGPAYYKDGDTYFGKDAPMPATVLNVIFETANAAQAGKFSKVEADYNKNRVAFMNAPLTSYVDDPSNLGNLQNDFTDPPSKRSLIQEYYEWQSFLLAKPALLEVAPKFTGELAVAIWDMSFKEILEFKNFEEYYNFYGKTHRRAVQATLK